MNLFSHKKKQSYKVLPHLPANSLTMLISVQPYMSMARKLIKQAERVKHILILILNSVLLAYLLFLLKYNIQKKHFCLFLYVF